METRTERWGMRASPKDKEQINDLATLLQVSETKAVSIAVSYMLAILIRKNSNIQSVPQTQLVQ